MQDYGITALHWPAAEMGTHTSVAEFLLEKGWDPKAENKQGDSPMTWAKREHHGKAFEKAIHNAEVKRKEAQSHGGIACCAGKREKKKEVELPTPLQTVKEPEPALPMQKVHNPRKDEQGWGMLSCGC